MTTASLTLLAVATALASWAGVAIFRNYALRRLMDVPSDRSSHARPTPRGGGLALAVSHVLGVAAAVWLGHATPYLFVALIGGGVLVATVGFLDDHGHVNELLRLICHAMGFAWAVWWLGGLPPIDFGWGPLNLGLAGTLGMLLYMTWFLNLFNFMDGIDGIAGGQSLTMCVTAFLLLQSANGGGSVAAPIALLAAATAGFLAWNWPPAKIFMGDVGSGYLGYALGVLALWTVVEGWLTPWVWLILGGTFLADATVTLAVRALSGVRVATAHRSHAYQRLSRHWSSHRRVTLAFMFVNVFWLGPWAWVATKHPSFGMFAAVAALTPLVYIALRLGAGRLGEIGHVSH